MKKLITLLYSFLIVSSMVMAQTYKGTAAAAEAALGKNDLATAKGEIDLAIVNELAKLKAKGKPEELKSKMYITKAKVYQAILLSELEEQRNLAPNALEEVLKCYDKIKAQEKEGSMTYTEVFGPSIPGITLTTPIYEVLLSTLNNKGVEYYNNQEMDKALAAFEKLIMVTPSDTNILANLVTIANELEDSSKVEKYTKSAIANGYKKPYLYYILATYAMARNNYDEAIKTIEDGLVAHPGNMDLMTLKINAYIKTNKTKEAIESLQKAVEVTPNDKLLHFNLGLLYEQIGELEKAKSSYTKAVEIDPEFYDGYYSLGAMNYNAAIEINKKMNDLEFDIKKNKYKDQPLADKYTADIKDLYGKSLPYFEKCEKLKPSDRQILELLERLYNNNGNKEQLKRVQAKLEAMGE